MRAAPGTTLRVASGERVELELGDGASGAVLRPRLGEASELDVTRGTVSLPAVGAPDVAELEWSSPDGQPMASRVEFVSRHYFTLDDLRGYGDGQDDFSLVPEDRLWECRQAATEVFERSARRSFVQRVGRTKDWGRAFLNLAHGDVYELLSEGYALVGESQAVPDGTLCAPYPRWVEYLYGLDSVPYQVSRAVLELAAYMLRPSNRPVGATGESTDAGFIRFTTAGQDGPTDIPEVNAAIEQFGRGVQMLW